MPRVSGTVLCLVVCVATASPAQQTGVRAFGIEAAGGIAGSMAGIGIVSVIHGGLARSCDPEDLACIMKRVGAAGVGSVIGAAAGTVVAGRIGRTNPSLLGASIGALAGAAAGVGVVHLLGEEMNLNFDRTTSFLTYSVVQGIVTALGSRAVAAIRD